MEFDGRIEKVIYGQRRVNIRGREKEGEGGRGEEKHIEVVGKCSCAAEGKLKSNFLGGTIPGGKGPGGK